MGGSFAGQPLTTYFWYALYAFVAVNVLYYRFARTGINYLSFQPRVDRVVKESSDAVSIYIGIKNPDKFKSLAGQFIMVRFLDRGLWLEEHPFSLSEIPKDGQLRLTVKGVGDYTAKLPDLKPGTRVLVSGPFGSFTSRLTTKKKRLYIAGGVGITPIRSLLEESGNHDDDSVLLYGNRTADDTLLADELARLVPAKNIHNVYSNQPDYRGEKGYVDAALISRLVPDFKQLDVYLCGPPPMMDGVISGLTGLGLPADQLHYERFSLHS